MNTLERPDDGFVVIPHFSSKLDLPYTLTSCVTPIQLKVFIPGKPRSAEITSFSLPCPFPLIRLPINSHPSIPANIFSLASTRH